MRCCLRVVLTVVVAAGCKGSSSQTPNDGGPADMAASDHNVPEINLGGSDASDARDAGKEGPPACTGPKCPVVLATDTDPSCCIALDGTYVYWVHFAGSGWSIMRVATGGGTPEYFDSSDFIVYELAIQNNVLYWTASDGIYRRDLAAGSPRATRIVKDSLSSSPIAADAANVYWGWSTFMGGEVRKAPLAGGTGVAVATGAQVVELASDGTNVYWTDYGTSLNSKMMMAPVGGGTPTEIANGLTNAGGVKIDGTSVYWYDSSNLFGTKFWKAPLGGGTPVMVAVTEDFGAYEMAVDGTNIYWAAVDTIAKAPVGGGAVSVVATGQTWAMYIGVDANNIYWLNNDSDAGAVMKIAK